MQKPLSEEQKQIILETAVYEFSEYGFEKANINTIAEKADVSVGVIYKYYDDKETLFTACVSNSLSFLDEIFGRARKRGASLMKMLDGLIEQVQIEAREHPEYFKLYLQLTAMSKPQLSSEVVDLIESSSARLYRSLFKDAKAAGHISKDIDSGLFAFFFDNMIMMLHFAYCCDYYEDRFKVFCGNDIVEKDQYVRENMMKFLAGAFGYTGE